MNVTETPTTGSSELDELVKKAHTPTRYGPARYGPPAYGERRYLGGRYGASQS